MGQVSDVSNPLANECVVDIPVPLSISFPLSDVAVERLRQDRLFGEQNHPDVSCIWGDQDREAYAVRAHGYELVNDERVAANALGWDTILLEEVFEALAESDPVKIREELVQVAAVAIAWAEAIDRRVS